MATTENTVTVRLQVAADGALRDLDRFDKELQQTAQSAARAGSATGAFEAQLERMTAAQKAGVPVQNARVDSMSREERMYQRLAASSSAESRARLKAERDLSRAAAAASNLVVQGRLSEEQALRDLMQLEAARNAQVEAAIVDAQRMAAANDTVATSNMRVGQTANRAAVRQNLMYQYSDIGVSLASGMPAHMIAVQQGAQIVGGPGGLNAALAETGSLARMVVTRFGLIGAAIGVGVAAIDGMKDEINETSDVAVSFGDVAYATWEVIARGIYNVIQPAIAAVAPWFTQTWNAVASATIQTGNTIVGVMVGSYNATVQAWGNLPTFFSAIGKMAWNNLVSEFEKPALTWGDQVIIPGFDMSAWKAELTEAEQAARGLAEVTFDASMNRDWMGEFFGDVRTEAIANATQRLEENAEATKGAGSAASKAADDAKKLADGLTEAEKAAKETAKQLAQTLGDCLADIGDGEALALAILTEIESDKE